MRRPIRGRGAALAALLAAAVAVAAALVILVVDRTGGDRAGGGRPPGPPPRVFAFVSGLGGAELRRLEHVGSRIDVVAPNWYALDAPSGRLRAPHPETVRRLFAAARPEGVRVWPTVNALTGGSRAWEGPAGRERIVRSLLAAARSPGAAGVTLDMEELVPAQRAAFSALVREAAARLHAADRELAAYVPRPGGATGAAYDWRALAASADLVLCAGYNEHWAGGDPGPVTTSGGFSAVLDHALELAGPDRAVPLLGAFGYRWPEGGPGTLISTVDAERLRRAAGAQPVRSDGSERFRAGADTVVYETAAGLRARAAAARAAGARWIGLFSLGREPAAFWRGLRTARGPCLTRAGEAGCASGDGHPTIER